MPKFDKLAGTSVGSFGIDALSATGPKLKNSAGTTQFRNKADTAFAGATMLNVGVSTNEGTPRKTTITMATGAAGDLNFALPNTAGTSGQVLQTDGAGNLAWVSAGSTANCISAHYQALAFGTATPLTLFTLPANAQVDECIVYVDTAFSGTPTMSIGVSGTTSKYAGTGDTDLTTVGSYRIPYDGAAVDSSSEALIVTYAAGGAAAGAARVFVKYSVPTTT